MVKNIVGQLKFKRQLPNYQPDQQTTLAIVNHLAEHTERMRLKVEALQRFHKVVDDFYHLIDDVRGEDLHLLADEIEGSIASIQHRVQFDRKV